ncbi:MAG: hypothetical protein ACRCYU_08470 [Nocardioides sp.]
MSSARWALDVGDRLIVAMVLPAGKWLLDHSDAVALFMTMFEFALLTLALEVRKHAPLQVRHFCIQNPARIQPVVPLLK